MTTQGVTDFEGTSGPLVPSMMRVLPRVEIQKEDSPTFAGLAVSAGFVVIRARWNFMVPIGFGGVTNFSKVMASITELFSNPGDAGQINLPGIGNAHMYVRSVAPQNNVVFVNGYIDWERDLTVRVTLLVA